LRRRVKGDEAAVDIAGVLAMPFDREAGGHAFDFDRDVCVKCGMSREKYQDNGKPPCKGKKQEDKPREPIQIDE